MLFPLFFFLLLSSSVSESAPEKCQTCSQLLKVRQEVRCNGSFSTVKVIHIRSALEQFDWARSIFLGQVSKTRTSFVTFWDTVVFYAPSQASHYVGQVTLDFLQSNTSLPITSVNHTVLPYVIGCE